MLALLKRPRLVILDELTQGLDPAARRNVWSAVDQLRDDGTAVLLVTHELDEAEALCDRVVAIRAGRVLDTGPPPTWSRGTASGRRSDSLAPALTRVSLDALRRLDGVNVV